MEKPFKRARADWTDVILVCRKCSKKLNGGFGPDGDEKLAKLLRRTIARTDAASGRRKTKGRHASLGVIEVGCMDICPKGAVMAVSASRPGQWLVVPRHAPMDQVLEALAPATTAETL